MDGLKKERGLSRGNAFPLDYLELIFILINTIIFLFFIFSTAYSESEKPLSYYDKKQYIENVHNNFDIEAIPNLLGMLEKEDKLDCKIDIIKVLGIVRCQQSLLVLGQMLNNSNIPLRYNASNSISQFKDISINSILKTHFEKEKDESIKILILKLLEERNDSTIGNVALKVVKDKNVFVRRYAYKILSDKAKKELYATYNLGIKDKDVLIRIYSAIGLAKLNDKTGQLILQEALINENIPQDLRVECAITLSELDGESSANKLIEYIKTNKLSIEEKYVLIPLLGKIKSNNACLFLIDEFMNEYKLPVGNEDRINKLKNTIINALGEISDKSVIPFLLNLMNSRNFSPEVVKVLAMFNVKEIIPIIKKLLMKMYPPYYSQSPSNQYLFALRMYNDPSTLPIFYRYFECEYSDKKIIIKCIYEIGDYNGLESMLKSKDIKYDTKVLILNTLAEYKEKRIVQFLLDILEKQDKELLEHSIRILGELKEEKAVPFLESMLKETKSIYSLKSIRKALVEIQVR